jgi:hypothetical protein
MKRFWLALAAVAAAAAIAAASSFATAERAPLRSSGSVRVLHEYAHGPTAECGGDSCGIGVVSPVRVTLPESPGRFRATVTVSFRYVTTAGSFTLGVAVKSADGRRVAVFPASRVLAARTNGDSTTLVFATAGLEPGATYEFAVGANVARRDAATRRITTFDMLVSIEAKRAN